MKIKALGELYPIPTRPLELGEQRRVKREFGFVPGRDELDLNDPDHVAAMLYAAMRQQNPEAPFNSIMASINRVREIELTDDDGNPLTSDEAEEAAEDAGPPTPTGNGESGSETGEPETTTPESSGPPS